MTADTISKDIVVLINPHSTGCCIAQEIIRRNGLVMAVWTSPELKKDVPSVGSISYFAQIDIDAAAAAADISTIVTQIQKAASTNTIVACLSGGDEGIAIANDIAKSLKLPYNECIDKTKQQEIVSAAGMRSIKQTVGSSLEDVNSFLTNESYPLVIKPAAAASSSTIASTVCHSVQEAKDTVSKLLQSTSSSVVCQEYVRGKEYVVDVVSLDSLHKTVMVWVYDQRPANGGSGVYFGCVPVDSESTEAKLLIPYVRGVLDALGIQKGPSHTKVLLTKGGPCLVEVHGRAHGGNGLWRPLCKALTGGYSQVEATAMALSSSSSKEFAALPDKPVSPFKASGQEVRLISYSRGTVKSTPGFDVLKCFPSFLSLESGITAGSQVTYTTTDLTTTLGSVMLMHPDARVLQKDIELLRHMEQMGALCVYEQKVESLQHRRSEGPSLMRHMSNDRPELRPMMRRAMTTTDASKEVVVMVDPYSTGCCVALEVQKRGYTIMALWTLGFAEEMKLHVPLSCEGLLRYKAEIPQAESMEDTISRIQDAASGLRVVSVIAGGEAGVVFADELSEAMNLRTNGTDIPNRCDKKIQQELIQAAGFRSVRQAGGSKFEQVEAFLNTEQFPVVLKPTESAGSDGVKLCHTFDEAKEHFEVLMASQMVNGGDCGSVLCQEFLRGKEYVVDHVSRDGVHKTMMVWVYDKRHANGSQFVYYACSPVDPTSPEARLVIPYIRGVLDALGVKNGPSHGEVMMTPTGPCLVEMNCRANGGDGNWRPLCLALTGGYSQVEAAVDSFLEKPSFDALPDKPPSPFKAFGHETFLVSHSRGTVKSTPGYDVIKTFPSFVYLESGIKPGSKVDFTTDFITCAGSVILMHDDNDVVEEDLRRLREMEKNNELFEYEQEVTMLKSFSKVDLASQVVISSDRAI